MTELVEGAGSYAARRILRTETSRATEQAGLEASRLNAFVVARKYNLAAEHPRPDECDALAAGSSAIRTAEARAEDLTPLSHEDAKRLLEQTTDEFVESDIPAGLVDWKAIKTKDQLQEEVDRLVALNVLPADRGADTMARFERDKAYEVSSAIFTLRQDLAFGSFDHTLALNTLQEYQNGDYMGVNRDLRGTLGPLAQIAPGEVPMVEKLDAAIAETELPATIRVYRGVSSQPSPSKKALLTMQPGDLWSDPGYMSTSLDRETAEDFASATPFTTDKPGILFDFTVPAGHPGLYVGTEFFGHGGALTEEEVVLPRDVQFRVTSVEEPSAATKGLRVIHLEVLSEAEALPLPEAAAIPVELSLSAPEAEKVLLAETHKWTAANESVELTNYDADGVPLRSEGHTRDWQVVQSYQDGSYMDRNTDLRNGRHLDRGDQGLVDELDAALQKVEIPAPIMTYRGVSTANAESGSKQKIFTMRVGDVWHDPGFMSTSLERSTAVDFATQPSEDEEYFSGQVEQLQDELDQLIPSDDDYRPTIEALSEAQRELAKLARLKTKFGEGAIFEFSVPSGTHGLFLGTEDFGHGGALTEREVLLQRNLDFVVTGIEEPSDATDHLRVIHLAASPPAEEPVAVPAAAVEPPLPERQAEQLLTQQTKTFLQPDIPAVDWEGVVTPEQLRARAEELVANGTLAQSDVAFQLKQVDRGDQSVPSAIASFRGLTEFGSAQHTEDVRILQTYQDGNFMERNTELRETDAVTNETLQQDVGIPLLDDALSHTVIPAKVVVYRGVSGEPSPAKDAFSQLRPGDVYVDPGFLSTSLHRPSAEKFTLPKNTTIHKAKPGYIFEITVPEGTHGLFLGVEEFGHGGALEEHEVLLPRNMQFRVVSVAPPGTTPEGLFEDDYVIKMEVLPPAEAAPEATAVAEAPPPDVLPGPPTAQTVPQIQSQLKELGITTNFSAAASPEQALQMAQRTLSGVQQLKREGVAPPHAIAAGDVPFLYPESSKGNIALTDPDNGIVYLNTKSDYWQNPAAAQAKLFAEHWMATPNPDHVILHEVGHSLQLTLDRHNFNILISSKFAPADQFTAMNYVSRYAAQSPAEFVAEVFAGLVSGKEYNDEVIDLYGRYGGPGVKSLPFGQ